MLLQRFSFFHVLYINHNVTMIQIYMTIYSVYGVLLLLIVQIFLL